MRAPAAACLYCASADPMLRAAAESAAKACACSYAEMHPDGLQAIEASGGILLIDQEAWVSGSAETLRSIRRRGGARPFQVILAAEAGGAFQPERGPVDDYLTRERVGDEIEVRLRLALARLAEAERLSGECEYYKKAVMQEEALSAGLVDLSAAIKDSEEAVSQVRRALRKANRALDAKNRDPLSGLLNRTGLMERIEDVLGRASEANVDLSGLMIDVDKFKEVNDSHGHLAGDAVLAAVGRRLASGLRRDDFAGRWGGEEFFAVLIGTSRQGALAIAQRLRESVSRLSIPAAEGRAALSVTVSIGVSEYRPGEEAEEWLGRADKAMYQAKRAGRNRVSWL